MKTQRLKKALQLIIGLTAVATFLVGCGEGGGKGSSKSSGDKYGVGAYCNTNQYGQGQQYGQYPINNGFNNNYNQYNNQNCIQGGTRQCHFNGSFYTDMQGRQINDPFRYGCNMQGQFGSQFGFQGFNGDSCKTYGPQWSLMNIRGVWVCSIPAAWGIQTQYVQASYSHLYAQAYYQLYPSYMLARSCGGAYAYANLGGLTIGANYGYCRR